MGLFRRKEKIVDLSEKYKRQKEAEAYMKKEQEKKNSSPLGFLGALASGASTRTNVQSESLEDFSSGDADEKRRKLAKRLMDMTEKIEDISNQIYHLQQRMEVIEKKLNVRNFE